MPWTAEHAAGFALLATVAGDRGGAIAAAGVDEGARDSLCAGARALAQLQRPVRRARVAQLAAARHAQRAAARELLSRARRAP